MPLLEAAMAQASALGNFRLQPARPVALGARFLGALLTLEAWADRRRQRQVLSELDDYMLRDIGITRTAAEHEARKPFWR